jgi:CheY-like chemotaxis protein
VSAPADVLEPGSSAPQVPGGRETVLVAEDESSVRAVAVRVLSDAGYRVLEAATGREALDVARLYPGRIDLLMTDAIMPQMSGQTLAEKLLAQRPEVRVLFVSGYAENTIVHQGVLEAGVAFLQKPFTAAAVTRKVRQVLDAS